MECSAQESRKHEVLSIEEIVDRKSQPPYLTSRGRGWGDIAFDLYRAKSDCAAQYPALDHHLISYCPSGTARLIQRRSGIVHDGLISGGMSLLMPAGSESSWDGDTATSLRLRIPTAFVDRAGEEVGVGGGSPIELRNVFEVRDTMVERVGSIIIAELESKEHPAQALIVEHLTTALILHLLRKYNGFDRLDHAAPTSALSRFELAKITEYVEDNMGRSISLAELAALVNVSRFHFARLFKRSTGQTAIAFVEGIRIRRAQSLISETDIQLAEIALLTGFADQSHFTRRFHRHIGSTPAAFASRQGRRRSTQRSSGR